MAAVRNKMPVGSAPWLVSERRQADELVDMETEEFGYVVRNEMEWLNEHMGEIFSNSNLNVTDIFKTPGKLRGKTPRTARKRNALGERAPLTDIFAPNPQANASPTKNQFYKQVAQIQLQQDGENNENSPVSAPSPPKHAVSRQGNWDSGYHGITDDEMEVERIHTTQITVPSPKKAVQPLAIHKPMPELPADERRATDETFVSAKENLASRTASAENLCDDHDAAIPDEEEDPTVLPVKQGLSATPKHSEERPASVEADDDADRMDVDDVRSPSDGSSPVKPLLRKSSLNFSSLPAREPLAGKKSIGARSSVLNQTRSSQFGRFTGGKSLGGQHTLATGDEESYDNVDVDTMARPELDREESETTKLHHQTTTQRLHDRINMLGQQRDVRTSKSIPNLNSSTTGQTLYPQIPQPALDKSEGSEVARPTTAPAHASKQPLETSAEDDDDDWIAPITSAAAPKGAPRPELFRTQATESVDLAKTTVNVMDAMSVPQDASPKRRFSPTRPQLPFGHKKSASSSAIISPTRPAVEQGHQKVISVSNPQLQSTHESTTPAGSPKRHLDGAVSATKAKLYSALRSARGIFASSANASAQAKMEALSPGPKSRQQQYFDEDAFSGHGAGPIAYPVLESQSRVTSAGSAASGESRRTRSSSEREQKKKDEDAKRMQKADDGLSKAREKERQKAAAARNRLPISPSKETLATQRPHAPSRTESERIKETADIDSADEMPPPLPPKSMLPTTQAQRLREPRRIAKPMKEALTRAKPAPVTVRMPSQRIGIHPGPSTASLSQSLQDTLPPPPPPKPACVTKGSTASLHSSTSTGTLRGGNPTQAAKKALDAAAKKKEQDAKAAQRKADQKREIEQRRAAKQEEERRRQEEERRRQEEERRKCEEEKRRADEERRVELQRRQAEQQRREEAKRNAQRQAAEAKRAEQQRLEQQRQEQQRLEQQRKEQQRAQQNEFAYALQQEKAQASAAYPRGDFGVARPVSRMMQQHETGRPPVQVNPAKPPKRVLADEEDYPQRPAVQRNPASYQQLDAKRRRTNENEDELAEPRRSVMAPPVRQSNIRKEPTKFAHGYAPAPPQHTSSMFIKTVTNNHQLNHGVKAIDTAKFANGRIPFADAPNPPGVGAPSNPHKTPGRQINATGAASAKSAHKSSPLYPNPENIHLPEIATDSEDEDSDNEFQAPDWTDSPALRQILTQQQLVDPLSVFGPIAPLRMEEVFKNKDRQKKFRDRTSSANWAGADRLTEEERIKDREAREKLMRDGGWTFQTTNNS